MSDKTAPEVTGLATTLKPPSAARSAGAPQIPVTRPWTPEITAIQDQIADVLNSGMLTNHRYVKEFERKLADHVEAEDAVAVSNCTTGLITTLSVLDIRGEILVPSFTFSATGHVCYWAGLEPVFVDCDSRDWTIQISDCLQSLGPATSAVMGVHTFGNPADVDALSEFATDNGLVLVFDAAHALGAEYKTRRLGGAGKASVFSLTPTKISTSGEGGVITTNDRSLANELRVFRNYGDDGSYDCRRLGLNGRMPELSAILGLATLERADREVRARNEYAEIYMEELAGVPGVEFQEIRPWCRSSYKDFTVLIDDTRFGATRDQLSEALARENVATRRYFDPPLHRQSAYRNRRFRRSTLQNTEDISSKALTLPMYSAMGLGAITRVCELIRNIQRTAVNTSA